MTEPFAQHPTVLTVSGDAVIVDIPEIALGWRGFDAETWAATNCRHPPKHKGPCESNGGGDWRGKNAFLDKVATGLDESERVLGRPRSVYFHRGAYNHVEAVLATWLVERLGVSPSDVVNEVFRLSAGSKAWPLARQPARNDDGFYAAGMRAVAGVLPAEFFAMFAGLVDANPTLKPETPKGRRLGALDEHGHNISVDLFARLPEGAALIEVKDEDDVLDHQLLALGFAAVAVRAVGADLWTGIIRVDTELSVGDVERRDPHRVEFARGAGT